MMREQQSASKQSTWAIAAFRARNDDDDIRRYLQKTFGKAWLDESTAARDGLIHQPE